MSVLKIILGAIVRHWLTSLASLLLVRHVLTDSTYRSLLDSIASQLGDDFVFSLATSALAALAPAAIAAWLRLKAKLRERIALLSSPMTSEREVKAMISEAPRMARVAATLTANPDKILKA